MADVLNFNVNRVWDINGDPVPFAQARFYNAGTSSVRQVYADQDGSVPHPSPLVADSEGVFPPVFTTGGEGVSVEITDEDGVMLDGYPVALAIRVPGDGFSASSIGFSPTGDIAATNVQDAIEQVQANLVAPLADYGLGVTGNGPLIANIDASDIPSGIYRYETTSTGTFPPGINGADGGTLTVWRRNNSSANMTLYSATANKEFSRRLANGTWSVWYETYLPVATETEARAGTSAATVMTPLGAEQHMNANALGWGGQKWQVVSRSVNTNYQNTTGRPIMVSARGVDGMECRVGETEGNSVLVGNSANTGSQFQQFIVPNGHYYRFSGGSLAEAVRELR